MATRKQIEAARRNGALSRGPVTSAGKKRSSENSLSHGLYSQDVVLPTENIEKFYEFKQDYLERYDPATRDELDLVEEIVMCRWRLIRHWTAECASLEIQMAELLPKIQKAAESFTPAGHLGIAYCASEKNLANFRRMEASLSRQALQAEKRLRELIDLRLAAEAPVAEPEPVAAKPTQPAPSPSRPAAPISSAARNEPPAPQPAPNQQPPEHPPLPLAPAA